MIEPRSRKTWVTTILETDDWLELADDNIDEGNVFRSKVELVGEVTLCCGREGENVAVREDPPPPLLPPPPPAWVAVVEAAAEDAKFELENGVVVRERGEDSSWLV